MRRKRREDAQSEGHDSFLDIVANLVGILIILVVVVGTQASTQLTKLTEQDPSQTQQALAELEAAMNETEAQQRALTTDNAQLQGRIQQEDALANMAELERDRLQQLVLVIEQKLDETSQSLGAQRQQEIEQQLLVNQLQDKIIQAEQELEFLGQQKTPTKVLQHHATPLAQTVFNDEIHFRMNEGQLSYVPMEELVAAMTSEVQYHVEKLQAAGETLETVGPIDDFRMQYALRMTEKTMRTELGVIRRQQPEFVGFILLPSHPVQGETIDVALRDPNSSFRSRLRRLNPQKTTVTIWVYPNSYDEYLQLETWLHEQKFLVASWPLPEGQPIAGGPNGYRSVAQ